MNTNARSEIEDEVVYHMDHPAVTPYQRGYLAGLLFALDACGIDKKDSLWRWAKQHLSQSRYMSKQNGRQTCNQTSRLSG